MNVDRFARERRPVWTELDGLLRSCGGRPDRLAPADALRLGSLYRGAAADLAEARRRFASDPVTDEIERLVVRGRAAVYGSASKRGTILSFFARDYWRGIHERPGLLAAAAFFLFGTAIAAGLWAWIDTERASGYLPGAFQAVAERRPGSLGIPVEARAQLSSLIFTNNIRVSFLAFALGITWGIGTAFLLFYNGLMIGVVAGLATAAGNGRSFVELVVAHGVLELSCIVVTAAAGLRLGWALVSPGYQRRGDVLRVEARRAVEILLGTVPWLVIAGLVEGFITPAGTGLAPVLACGFGLGAIYWGLVAWRGAHVHER